jgi:hypothetical protein
VFLPRFESDILRVMRADLPHLISATTTPTLSGVILTQLFEASIHGYGTEGEVSLKSILAQSSIGALRLNIFTLHIQSLSTIPWRASELSGLIGLNTTLYIAAGVEYIVMLEPERTSEAYLT